MVKLLKIKYSHNVSAMVQKNNFQAIADEKGNGCKSRTITVAVCIEAFFLWWRPVIGKLRRQENKRLDSPYTMWVGRPALMPFCKVHIMHRNGSFALLLKFCANLLSKMWFSQKHSAVVILKNCRGFFICPASDLRRFYISNFRLTKKFYQRKEI